MLDASKSKRTMIAITGALHSGKTAFASRVASQLDGSSVVPDLAELVTGHMGPPSNVAEQLLLVRDVLEVESAYKKMVFTHPVVINPAFACAIYGLHMLSKAPDLSAARYLYYQEEFLAAAESSRLRYRGVFLLYPDATSPYFTKLQGKLGDLSCRGVTQDGLCDLETIRGTLEQWDCITLQSTGTYPQMS